MAEVQNTASKDADAFINSERENESKSIVENGTAKISPATDPKEQEVGTEEESHDEKEEKKESEEPEWMDILGSGQLLKKVLKKGQEGYRPERGEKDLCEISYEARRSDGTIVEKGEHVKINLGDGDSIQGIDLLLPLMEEGEQCLLEVGPRFAYGSAGRPAVNDFPAVGENETLTYTIELHSFMPEPELVTLSIAERKKIGNKKRERGNFWYGRKENTLAIHCYRRALEYLDEATGGINFDPKETDEKEEDELKDLLEDRLKVYNNMAACQLKIGALDAGLISCENVLRCQPNNVKAIYRKAKILSEKGEVSAAVETLQRAITLEPDNKLVKTELQILRNKAKQASIQEKNLYRKMMGSSSSQSRSAGEANSTDSTGRSKLIPWGMVFGSVAVVLAGVVAYRYKFL